MAMRIYFGCLLLLLAVGCERRSTDRESVDTAMVFQATPPSATPDSSHVPQPPVLGAQRSAAIPDQFRGKWASSQARCGIPSESALAIDADRVDFYEGGGRVLAVKVVSEREMEVDLESSGEGQVQHFMRRFALSEDGHSLTDVTMPQYPTVRVRCDSARVGP